MAEVVVRRSGPPHGPGADPVEEQAAAITVDMRTPLGGLTLPAPVLTASGCAGMGRELAPFVDLTLLGAVVTKSVMINPRAGRPTPRMAETPSGMLNAIGLQGPGLEELLAQDLPWLAERGVRVVVSIAGESVGEYGRLARRLRGQPGVSAIEVNISCPNVDDRGLVFACQPVSAAAVTAAVREADPGVPVLVKLSPDVTDLVSIAAAVVQAGADGLTLVNTLLGMALDPVTLRPALAGGTGGLSGPAIHPIAVRAVHQVHAILPDVPLIGVGGVTSGWSAFELVAAGASAIEVGTATFTDPSAPAQVLAELRGELARRGIERFTDAIGLAHRPPGPDDTPTTGTLPAAPVTVEET